MRLSEGFDSHPTGSSRGGDAEVGEADGGEPGGAEPDGRPPVEPPLGVAQLAHELLAQEAVLDAGEAREQRQNNVAFSETVDLPPVVTSVW